MNGLLWYGPILKKDNEDVLGTALHFEVVGKRGCGRPKITRRRPVEKLIEQMD